MFTCGVPCIVSRGFAVALVATAVACGSMGGSTGPAEAEEIPAVTYTMEGTEFLPSSQLPPNLMIVMSVENEGSVPVEKSYPAGCPVRIRIYRDLDDTLIYDETKLGCSNSDPATFRVLPGETRTIGSGFRQMTQIMGDSIPCGRYRLVGVPQMEGDEVIEIPAGEAFLRAYPSWPAANPNAVYHC